MWFLLFFNVFSGTLNPTHSLTLLFFPHLISAVGYWMFTILPHMVWP